MTRCGLPCLHRPFSCPNEAHDRSVVANPTMLVVQIKAAMTDPFLVVSIVGSVPSLYTMQVLPCFYFSSRCGKFLLPHA